jgi:hypothetical protein
MTEIETLKARVVVLEKALREIQRAGEVGLRPDYRTWLTFHDKIAELARAALAGEGKDGGE